jgi:hypothetical protein
MMKIRFLSHVRCFTYGDDLKSHIIQRDQWKENPFHFRLYFDSLSASTKGLQTLDLMIDVDRPNVEIGVNFLNFFDGDSSNSPGRIPCMFFPHIPKNILLAMPAQGTTTGKLFLQIEHQPTGEWLICCSHSLDAAKVTPRLGGLDSSLNNM